ncbi:MAG: lysophospholipid acyltransferase family protein, partial [Gemmatimonadota bacterium]|nr:lysophospholipid acyltransferase family protein [Gemmatimonadota bacterium]
VPLSVVARRVANPWVDRAIRRARGAMGIALLQAGEAHGAIRALAEGRMVALLADQDAGPGGVFVPFFGRDASTVAGPAVLALRTGAPLFLAVVVGDETSEIRHRVVIRPVPTPRTGDRGADVRRITADFTRMVEEAVRRSPEDYFWQHHRWKTRPAGSPPPEQVPTGQV